MTLAEAKQHLDGCIRDELDDHAFGDAEVEWYKDDVVASVASGYFGSSQSVTVYASEGTASFGGADARALRYCGNLRNYERNDQGQKLPWMPPEPGWLGKLIEEGAESYRRDRARACLIELGVAKYDLHLLREPTGDRWVRRLATKYKHLKGKREE